MRTDAKVVHLNKAAPEHRPSSPATRLPVAIISVRDKAAQQLRQALQALFDSADDSLFEIADRATSNAEQNAFFEAMRDLRMKRRSIERSFLQHLFESFTTLNQYQIGQPPQLESLSVDNLTLVQNDELEESVAIDTMVAKVMGRAATPLSHLTTRMNTLVSRKLDDKSNPLSLIRYASASWLPAAIWAWRSRSSSSSTSCSKSTCSANSTTCTPKPISP